jgi:hypothetical protein
MRKSFCSKLVSFTFEYGCTQSSRRPIRDQNMCGSRTDSWYSRR